MDILSKGGYSVPVILASILECLSTNNVAYGASQTDRLDTTHLAGSSLSSAFSPKIAYNQSETTQRTNRQSPTAWSAGNALGNALAPSHQGIGYQSANQDLQQTTDTQNDDASQSGQTKANPPGTRVVSRLEPSPSFPGLLAPVFVSETVTSAKQVTGYIEVGARNEKVTNNQGNWNDQYILGVFQTDDKNTWNIGLSHNQRFYDTGDYGSISNTHNINKDWYSSVGVGISDTSDLVPKYYLSGKLFKKQGPRRQIIGYLGAHAYWWRGTVFGRNGMTQNINPGFVYYFKKPLVLEAGAYISHGNPGAVYSASGFFALTQGKNKDHYYSFRFGFGREAYLPTGLGFISSPTFAYPSYSIGVNWRKWVGKNWGFNLHGEYYHNQFFQRYGGAYGLFWEFGES